MNYNAENLQSSEEKYSMTECSPTQSPWNALRNGSRKSAFLPYKVKYTNNFRLIIKTFLLQS